MMLNYFIFSTTTLSLGLLWLMLLNPATAAQDLALEDAYYLSGNTEFDGYRGMEIRDTEVTEDEFVRAALAASRAMTAKYVADGYAATGSLPGAMAAFTIDKRTIYYHSSVRTRNRGGKATALGKKYINAEQQVKDAMAACLAHRTQGNCGEILVVNYFLENNPTVNLKNTAGTKWMVATTSTPIEGADVPNVLPPCRAPPNSGYSGCVDFLKELGISACSATEEITKELDVERNYKKVYEEIQIAYLSETLGTDEELWVRWSQVYSDRYRQYPQEWPPNENPPQRRLRRRQNTSSKKKATSKAKKSPKASPKSNKKKQSSSKGPKKSTKGSTSMKDQIAMIARSDFCPASGKGAGSNGAAAGTGGCPPGHIQASQKDRKSGKMVRKMKTNSKTRKLEPVCIALKMPCPPGMKLQSNGAKAKGKAKSKTSSPVCVADPNSKSASGSGCPAGQKPQMKRDPQTGKMKPVTKRGRSGKMEPVCSPKAKGGPNPNKAKGEPNPKAKGGPNPKAKGGPKPKSNGGSTPKKKTSTTSTSKKAKNEAANKKNNAAAGKKTTRKGAGQTPLKGKPDKAANVKCKAPKKLVGGVCK